MYVDKHAFQGVVRPCRGQRASLAQSKPDCQWKVGTPWALPWERTFHGSVCEVRSFHWHSQALTARKGMSISEIFSENTKKSNPTKTVCLSCRILGYSAVLNFQWGEMS